LAKANELLPKQKTGSLNLREPKLITNEYGSCPQSPPIYLTRIWSFLTVGFLKIEFEETAWPESIFPELNNNREELFLPPPEGVAVNSSMLYTTTSVTKVQRNKPAFLSIYRLVAQN